nr:MAG TPA: hypothetical protein [Caudoviricetes sp.]
MRSMLHTSLSVFVTIIAFVPYMSRKSFLSLYNV